MITRYDGRRNLEYRQINFKMDVIPSSLKSFYIEYGSSKFLIAIYGPLRRKKNKKLKCCQFETVLLEIFEKPSSFNNLEKSSFFINSIICFNI